MSESEWAALTPRQREVARLVGEGWTNKQIAARLHLTPQRVRVHVTAIAFLLGFDRERDCRLQLAVWIATRKAA